MKRFLCVVLCLVLCLSALAPLTSKAIFGSFSGGSDYDDSDYDWEEHDSNWDDNSGVSSGGGNSGVSSSGGGDPDASSSGGGSFGLIMMVCIFVFLIFFLAITVGTKKRKYKHKHRHHHRHHHHYHHHHHHTASGAQHAQDLRPISEFVKMDPAFDLPGFQDKLSNLYVQMQGIWQDKNMDALQPYFTDAMFAQMNQRLDALRWNKQTRFIEKIAVLSVEIQGFRQSDGQDTIVAELRARKTDYTLDDTTGKLISGSRTHEKFVTYEWDLTRPTGTLTEKQEAMQSVTCPHCGAALNINETAKCPYCDSIITLEQHDWVISAIRRISQITL